MSEKSEDKNMVKETVLTKKYNTYTYGDYLNWPDDKRYELIAGQPYLMSPAPSRKHQDVLLPILDQIYNYLKDKKCKVYCAPFDVKLPEGKEKDEDISTVVQPDIVVVCDQDKLDEQGCKGAPDLVVEIISTSSVKKDKKIKRELYERHGIKEYWLVDYTQKIVEVFLLDKNNEYGKPDIYTTQDKLSISIFADLNIDLETVFRE